MSQTLGGNVKKIYAISNIQSILSGFEDGHYIVQMTEEQATAQLKRLNRLGYRIHDTILALLSDAFQHGTRSAIKEGKTTRQGEVRWLWHASCNSSGIATQQREVGRH